MKIDGLIFDLDGTLWDASESCVRAWNSALQNKGVTDFVITQQHAHAFAGKLLDDIFEQYFLFLPKEEYQNMANAYAEQEKFHMREYGGKLYRDVREMLTELGEKYPLFIVSNCLSGYIENFLQQYQLEHLFTDYECSGNTGKPKAENIGMIISRNQLKNPVYVGDTMGDFEAAKKNGIPFIYAEYGFGEVEGNEYAASSFAEMSVILEGLN
ncbi:MAG TPA: HAD family hydrolase [Mucilaginibacter sp.]|nr:HAD family hydrolase [Mucilaginibacter sp.]